MSRQQQKHFHTILSRQLEQLLQGVDRTVGSMQAEISALPDDLDRASQEEGRGLELKTRDRERKLISKVQEALKLIESGDYGYCEACGEEIGIRRLEARPSATKCIDCKQIDEMEERHRFG